MENIDNSMANFIIQTTILAITGIIMAISVVLRKRIGEKIAGLMERLFNWKIYDHYGHMCKAELEKDKRINTILTELRIKTKADRAQVFQFKNGEIFTSKNQVWKVFCTHESVETVKSTQENLQQILSSCVTDLIFPFWEDDKELDSYPGVVRLTSDVCQCPNQDECDTPLGVYFYRVSGLKPGYSKSMLLAHSVVYMLQTPILDAQENIIGFAGLDWCWEEANVSEIEKNANILCKCAQTISYEMTTRKKIKD